MAAQDMAKTVRIDATVSGRRIAPVTRTRSNRARGRPRPEDAAAIDHELLAIALGLFLQHGYGGTSMRQIVAAAGVSKTTLYSRFPSKADLFRAIMIQQIDRLSPSASLQSEDGPLALEAGLRSYANQMLAVSLEGDVLGVNRLIYSESHRFPELGSAAAERTALGIARISDFVRTCARNAGRSCNDPRGIAEAFIFMIRGWYVNVILTNRDVPVAERERWVKRAVRALVCGQHEW